MNKLFNMARQLGTTMKAKIAAMLAIEMADFAPPIYRPRQSWLVPDQRNSSAAADKRAARRRRHIAKRGGRS